MDEVRYMKEYTQFQRQVSLQPPAGRLQRYCAIRGEDLQTPRLWRENIRWSKFTPYCQNLFIILALLQMLISLGLFTFAIIRYRYSLQVF